MSKQAADSSEKLQQQIDELKTELNEIKDFLMHISTEAQSITFDECKIEQVIIQQSNAEDAE